MGVARRPLLLTNIPILLLTSSSRALFRPGVAVLIGGMALPRFLYSHSESVHEKFIPESGCEDPLLVSPKTKRDFTGALSKSKKEIANNPVLRVGNLQESSESEGGADDIKDASSSAQLQQKGDRREWEFGAAAMELSEPGAGERSDSDESGILEHMGEERMKKKEGNGVIVGGGGGEGRAINDGGDSESFPGATSRSTIKRISTV